MGGHGESNLMGSDIIDENMINDGIVYVEGGIGLYKKTSTP